MPLSSGPFQRLSEKWIAFREFLVLYREVRRELRFSRRRSGKLNKSILRLEARIPFYIQMLSAAEEKTDPAAVQARDKLGNELENLLATLEGQRRELELLRKATSYEANRMELSLLQNLYPQRIRAAQLSVALALVCFLALFAGLGWRVLSRRESPRREMSSEEAWAAGPTAQVEPSPKPPAPAATSPPQREPPAASGPKPKPKPTPGKALPSGDLGHAEAVVRWHSLQERIKDDAADLSLLLQSCKDPDPRIRGLAASVLPKLGDPEAVKVLRSLRSDPEPYVRLIAEEALRRANETKASGR